MLLTTVLAKPHQLARLICAVGLLIGLFAGVAAPSKPVAAAAALGFELLGPFSANAVNTIDIRTVVMADFNLDGKNDLATSSQGINTLSVWLGNGDGTIGPAVLVASGGFSHWGLAAGDVNRDGKPDLVLAGSTLSRQISVLLGFGDSTFAPLQTYSTGNYRSKGNALADFNEDGNLDVAVANGVAADDPGFVSLLLGNGDGTLQTFTSFATGGKDPFNLAIGDFNGDQHLDIAASNHGSGTVGVILGDGHGNFGPPATYPAGGTSPTAVAAGDFDNDGVLDLAVVQEFGSIHTLEILQGNGNGTFAAQPVIPFSGLTYPKAIVVEDFDLDGNVDLAIGIGYRPEVLTFKGNGDLTFTGPASFPIGGVAPNWSSLVVGNLNGDAVLDIAVGNFNLNRISVLLNAAPVIDAAVDPTANANGWWNDTPVTVRFSCYALRGVAGLTPDTPLSLEGGSQTATGVCAELGGNTASTTVSGINIDLTNPVLTGAATAAPNGAGWYNQDVNIQWTCADALSGIAGSCPADSTVTGEGAALQASATIADKAGNQTTTIVSPVKIDRTPPALSYSATAGGHPYTPGGWANASVTVTFACTDDVSGVASVSSPVILLDEGSEQLATGACADNADNTATLGLNNINIDQTPPSLSPTVSPDTIPLNGSAPVSANASDALSGVASQSCGALDTSTAGTKTVSCTATDNAGNSASAAASYTVYVATGFTFTGFFQPVDNLPTLNAARAGRAIPVKFSLGGDFGLEIFAAGYPASQPVSCATGAAIDDIETTFTAGASSLSYDPAADQYTYTWKTQRTWAGTCRQFTLRLSDGTDHVALFTFK